MNTITINLDDIKTDFFGLTARLEHLPTGITITEKRSNSLIRNYTEAFLILKARIENNSNIIIKSKTSNQNKVISLPYINGVKS